MTTRKDDAAETATRISESLHAGDRSRALRQLIQLADDLLSASDSACEALTVVEPSSTGERLWDAAIAGLAAWRLGERGLLLPAWVSSPERKLLNPEPLSADRADPIPEERDIPEEFWARGVLVWADTFASV
jgi:hypothetical protein